MSRTVPRKTKGCCGTSATAARSLRRGTQRTSWPSMRTPPAEVSASLSSAEIRVDFPAPVRPATPRDVPGGIQRLSPASAQGPRGT